MSDGSGIVLHPYAASRLDALRRLRDEGYAVVDREGYERLRDQHQALTSENEQQRKLLDDARLLIEPHQHYGMKCARCDWLKRLREQQPTAREASHE